MPVTRKEQLDEEISQLIRLAKLMTDERILQSIKAQIVGLEAEKATLHPTEGSTTGQIPNP
jgi:5-bromo-4-chloroindolyl phosphate hydrolysis protein